MKQPLQANSNRTRAYYPIETKKNQETSQHPPQQPQPHPHPHHPHQQQQMRI